VTDTSSTTGTDSHAAHALEVNEVLPKANDRITKAALLDPKTKRLVEWNADILLRLLRQVTANRQSVGVPSDSIDDMKVAEDNLIKRGGIVFDELADTISLPAYDSRAHKQDAGSIHVDQAVASQLRHYVASIASMYRTENKFHNFEHCSHVTMSVNKLLNRIIGKQKGEKGGEEEYVSYGILNDPVTQFAVVLSALVHDVGMSFQPLVSISLSCPVLSRTSFCHTVSDHYGVPNAQLVNEGASIAEKYRGKSVLEQNSVDVAWELLMDDSYTDLRRAIYCNKEELKRFRQIVVATVMATDIADAELKNQRNERWAKVFDGRDSDCSSEKEAADRKAIIVIEHIIQASDVAHTMQHWHIYRKWVRLASHALQRAMCRKTLLSHLFVDYLLIFFTVQNER
jgi:3'5'-cyclic nucleotide phosphodiesterase